MTIFIILALIVVLCLVFGRLMGNTAYSIHHAKTTGKPVRSEEEQEQLDIDRYSR